MLTVDRGKSEDCWSYKHMKFFEGALSKSQFGWLVACLMRRLHDVTSQGLILRRNNVDRTLYISFWRRTHLKLNDWNKWIPDNDK